MTYKIKSSLNDKYIIAYQDTYTPSNEVFLYDNNIYTDSFLKTLYFNKSFFSFAQVKKILLNGFTLNKDELPNIPKIVSYIHLTELLAIDCKLLSIKELEILKLDIEELCIASQKGALLDKEILFLVYENIKSALDLHKIQTNFIEYSLKITTIKDLLNLYEKNITPLNSCYDVIKSEHDLEFFKDQIGTIEEVYRLLKNKGIFKFKVYSTDGRGAFQNPQHQSYWNENTFQYFSSKRKNNLKCLFRLLEIKTFSDSKNKVAITLGVMEALKEDE